MAYGLPPLFDSLDQQSQFGGSNLGTLQRSNTPSYFNQIGSTSGIGGLWNRTMGNQVYEPTQNLMQNQAFMNSNLQALPENLQNQLYSSPQTINTINGILGNNASTGAQTQQLNALASNMQNQALADQQSGMSAFDWGKLGLGALQMGIGYRMGQKQLNMAKDQFNEQRALNRSNFRNQARQINSSYRDQMSGRGFVGMSNSSRRALGRTYNRRKLDEEY